LLKNKNMKKILDFGKFVEINNSRLDVIKTESSDDEVRYDVRLRINEQVINGQIFVDKQGELECWQFYDSEGSCLSETYGQDNMDKLVNKKLKKIRKSEA
jgi:hypothetical protein